MRVTKFGDTYSPKHGQLNLLVPYEWINVQIGSYGFVWTRTEGILL